MNTHFNKGEEWIHEDAWEKNILERRENKHSVNEVGVGRMPGGGTESVSEGPEIWEAGAALQDTDVCLAVSRKAFTP